MQHRWFGMRLWMLALCATSLTVACGDNTVERVSRSGKLQFALKGTAASGIEYRLRHGTFAITGASTASASTEDNLQTETISVELNIGDYSISLNAGWQLEAATPDGGFANVEATLISANPQSFTIAEKKTTSVTFRFRVGDDIIVLGTGSVSISIEVDESTASTGGAGGATGGSAGNATTVCTGGACHVIACPAGYADCDGIPDDGCEADLASNASNCGACGNACELQNASPVCLGGRCAIGGCLAGYGDCDGLADDGCETRTTTDATHCGVCGNACPAAQNAQSICLNGACQLSCGASYADCDKDPTNGCETDISNHCDVCDDSCPLPNAIGLCVDGECRLSVCQPGYGDCDGNATNGCEADLQTDLGNCGSCGNICPLVNNGVSRCRSGSCGFDCNRLYADCDSTPWNGCESMYCGRCCPLGTDRCLTFAGIGAERYCGTPHSCGQVGVYWECTALQTCKNVSGLNTCVDITE